MPLTLRHIKTLRRAVDEASGWRGSMTGNPDPAPLEEFDAFIAEAREAIREVVKLRTRSRGEDI